MKYVFNRRLENGSVQPEEVQAQKYGWGVVYKDGSELKQFGDDGIFHQFQEIDQEQVEMFVVYELENLTKRYDFMVTAKRTNLFFFYRTLKLEVGGENERDVRVLVFGYKDLPTDHKHYCWLLPDGRCIQTDYEIKDLTQFGI